MRSACLLLALLGALTALADESGLSVEQRMARAIDRTLEADARRQAVLALGEAPAGKADQVAKLLRDLAMHDSDPFIRMAAVQALADLRGQAAREDLTVLLVHERANRGHLAVMGRIRTLLQKLRPLIPLQKLVDALRSAEPAEQLNLLEEVARHPAEGAYRVLGYHIRHDPDPAVRQRALSLAVRVAPERGLADAERILGSDREPAGLRSAAVQLYAASAKPEAAEKLLRSALEGDPSPELVLAVVRAVRAGKLQNFADLLAAQLAEAPKPLATELVHTLTALALAREDADREAAMTRLVERIAVVPPLEELPFGVAAALVRALGRRGSPKHASQLAAQLPELRQLELIQRVCRALGRLGGPGSNRALITCFERAPAELHVALLQSLTRLRSAGAWPRVKPLLPRVQSRSALRALALYLGAVAPAAEAERELDKLLRRERTTIYVLRDLLVTRGWIGPEAGLMPTVRTLAGPEPTLSRSAATILRRMAPSFDASHINELFDALPGVDGAPREVLALTIAFSGHPAAAERLQQLLPRAIGSDRIAFLRALGVIGLSDESALELSRRVVADEKADPDLQLAAVSYLGTAGELTDAPAIATLGDRAAKAGGETALSVLLGCAQAIAALGAGSEHERVLRWLALLRPHPRWGRMAYDMYARLPGRAVTEQLIADIDPDQARTPGAHIRLIAVRALGARREGFAAILRAAREDRREYVRAGALRALGDLGDPRAVEPIIAIYEQTGDKRHFREIREAAATALGALGGERARTWLTSRLEPAIGHGESVNLLAAAARAGATLSPQLVRRLAQAAPGSVPLAAGARALAGDRGARRWLHRDLRSPLPGHQAIAHIALEELGDKPYFDLVLRRAHIEPFPRFQVQRLARRLTGSPPLGAADRPAQDKQIAALRAWWKANRDTLRWDPERKAFVSE